jgi:hypothetical protein
MATEDEAIRLKLIIEGQADAKKLADQLAGVRVRQDELNVTFARGYITANQYARSKKELATEARNLERDMNRVTRATDTLVAKQAGLAGGFAKSGQTIMATGRILQDAAQGGFAAIVNNTEQLGMGLAKLAGKSAAIGAAVGGIFQIVATAALLALPHVTKFLEWLSPGRVDPFKTSVERTTERIEALKKKIQEANGTPLELAVNRDELRGAEADLKRLTAAQEVFNAAKTGKSKNQRESEARIAEAITPEATKALQKREAARLEKSDPAYLTAKDQLARMQADFDARANRSGPGGGNTDQQVAALQEQQQTVQRLRGAIGAPDGAADKSTAMLMKGDPAKLSAALRASGQIAAADAVDANTPEMIGRQNAAAGEYERTLKDAEFAKKNMQGPGGDVARRVADSEQATIDADRKNLFGPGREIGQEMISQGVKDDDRASSDKIKELGRQARAAAAAAGKQADQIVKANEPRTSADIDRMLARGRSMGLDDAQADAFAKREYVNFARSRGLANDEYGANLLATKAVGNRRDAFNAENGSVEKTMKDVAESSKSLKDALDSLAKNGLYSRLR